MLMHISNCLIFGMGPEQVYAIPLLFFNRADFCSHANAGVYGAENWGEMYWGDSPATSPIFAPTIASVVATEGQITITLDNFPVGTGADGWSAVTAYTVTCGETSAEASGTEVTITGLDSDTDYSCSVTASNALGESPEIIRVVTTAALKGVNFLLICSAIECGRTDL
jgi:hypothetical protein